MASTSWTIRPRSQLHSTAPPGQLLMTGRWTGPGSRQSPIALEDAAFDDPAFRMRVRAKLSRELFPSRFDEPMETDAEYEASGGCASVLHSCTAGRAAAAPPANGDALHIVHRRPRRWSPSSRRARLLSR